jgi:hypothetical protein
MKEVHQCGDIHFIYDFQNSTRFGVTAALQHEGLGLKIRNLGH